MSHEGATVLNYRVVRKLGEGGFGIVYLAEHIEIGRPAAVKILHPEIAKNPEMVQRFFREARGVCKIGHRTIIDIENYGRLENGEPFILMEYFPGITLAVATAERRFTPVQYIASLGPVASALEAAHAKGVIHRDLKPDNIMIRMEGEDVCEVRLLDFGIAKLLENNDAVSLTNRVLGTPYFMAPEQALDAKSVDKRADVFALAATLFASIASRAPFWAETPTATLIKLQTEKAPMLRTFAPEVSRDLEQAIAACLEKDREARPATIAAAWEWIRDGLVKSKQLGTSVVGMRSRAISEGATVEAALAAMGSGPTAAIVLPHGATIATPVPATPVPMAQVERAEMRPGSMAQGDLAEMRPPPTRDVSAGFTIATLANGAGLAEVLEKARAARGTTPNPPSAPEAATESVATVDVDATVAPQANESAAAELTTSPAVAAALSAEANESSAVAAAAVVAAAVNVAAVNESPAVAAAAVVSAAVNESPAAPMVDVAKSSSSAVAAAAAMVSAAAAAASVAAAASSGIRSPRVPRPVDDAVDVTARIQTKPSRSIMPWALAAIVALAAILAIALR